MLAFPYPYIANTLGWMTAELGRQSCSFTAFFTRATVKQSCQQRDAIFTLIGSPDFILVIGCCFSV